MEVGYDITRLQPQLFVVEEFAQLGEVLEAACQDFAFRSGGLGGLETAAASGEVHPRATPNLAAKAMPMDTASP